MKRFFKFLTVALCVAILGICAGTALADTGVSAYNCVKLDTLANQNLLKLNGRVRVESGYLSGDYSGTGFSTNIVADCDTELEVYFDTNYTNKVSIMIDGWIETTEMIYGTDADHGNMVSVDISEGAHEITVIKESQVSSSTTAYFHFTDIRFEGKVVSKVADKALLLEVVGDSCSCGDGADATYQVGTAWTGTKDDAITKAFGWYLAEMMDADYREVGRGGQGLDGTAAQEAQANKATMPILYDYMNYTDWKAGTKWVETRTPDVVVVELGANDTCNESSAPTWAGIAKNFLIKLETKYAGQVPIVWDFTGSKSYFYRALRDLVETDPELSTYGNIYLLYNYLDGNGSAALASQLSGHPDEFDQYNHAERIYNFIETEGVLGIKEPVSTHQYVYYVSATGNDSNDGLTPATAKLTVPSAASAAKTAVSALSTVAADAEVVIKVTGEVRLGTGQNLLQGIEKAQKILRADGSILPYVIETNEFDGTNRARVRLDFKPVNSGNASVAVYNPVVFKDIDLHFIEGDLQSDNKKYTVQNIYAQASQITFDNAIITTDSGATVNVNASPFSYLETYHKGICDGTEQLTYSVTFLHGTYNASTGFGNVSAVGGANSMWASAGTKTAAPGLTCEIIVGNGAVMDGAKLKMFNSTLTVKNAVIKVLTGGQVIGNFKGTGAGTSSTSNLYHGNATLQILGGHFKGAFAMLGNYADLVGDTVFLMTGGEIFVPAGTSEETNSISLGGGYQNNVITGNEYKEIRGGMIYIIGTSAKNSSGTVYQSGIHMSGRATQTVSGVSENLMTGGSILLLPDITSTKNTASAVYFGLSSGSIKGELRNIIRQGFIDQSQYGNTLYFAGQAVAYSVNKLTNVIGVQSTPERSEGPCLLATTISLSSGWGQFGRTSYTKSAVTDALAITSHTVVVSTTIYGGTFSGTVNLSSTGTVNTTSGYYPRTEGSVEAYIYGGRFNNSVCCKNGGYIYGHMKVVLAGGYYKNIYATTSTTSSTITDGLEVEIGDIYSYGTCQTSSTNTAFIGPFSVATLSKGSIQAITGAYPKFKVTVTGGQGYGNFNFADSNSVLGGTAPIVSFEGGKYNSVSNAPAGSIKGGWFATAPAASQIAAGYSVKNFAAKVDQLYTCYVANDEYDWEEHKHCVCGNIYSGYPAAHQCSEEEDQPVWTPLMSAADVAAIVSASAPKNGYYYLANDIQMTGAVSLPNTYHIHICLNGHTLHTAPRARAFIAYQSGATLDTSLTITDCQEMPGTIEGGYYIANGGNILMFSGSTFNLYNGTIENGCAGGFVAQGSTSYGTGGNVNIGANATFNMYGGTIRNGKARIQGGNVSCSGTFNMYGGTIESGRLVASPSNLTQWLVGGNLYIGGSNTVGTMYDGLIEGGKANNAGNVYTSTSFILNGGTINAGEALTENGGNIVGDKASTITIHDGVVRDGKAYGRKNTQEDKKYIGQGGNIFVQGAFVMDGGYVYNGEANYRGGNIFLNNSATTLVGTISGGEVSNGIARFGGNISLEGTASETKKLTISGTADIYEGEAHYNATGGDGHGGNFYLSTGAEVIVCGGEIHDGKAGKTCGGGNFSLTADSSILRIQDGARIYNAGAWKEGEEDREVSCINIFNAAAAPSLEMTGGFIGVSEAGQTVLNISSKSTTVASITGGYVQGVITGTKEGYISGGYYNYTPQSKYLVDGHVAFKLDPNVQYEGRSFTYEVAAGFSVILAQRALEGEMSSVNLAGGGTFRVNESTTITTQSEVGPYRFLYWEDYDTQAVVSTNTSYTVDYSTTYGPTYCAVYEVVKTGIHFVVEGTSFTISKKEPTETEFSAATAYTSGTTTQYPAGTQIVLTYTGDGDFAAWSNDTKKFVTTSKEYAFTLYIDTKLNETIAEPVETTGKKVTILYMNAYNQVLKTVDGADVATVVPEVPTQIGKETIGWDKSISDLQALIAEVQNGESKIITVLPVYEDKAKEGTITVFQMTGRVNDNGYFGADVKGTVPFEFTGLISEPLDIVAPELDGYKFACFTDNNQIILTFSDHYSVRPTEEGVVLYAGYVSATAEVETLPLASLSYTGIVESGTAQVDVTRTIPTGYSIVEQGFLLTNSALGCNSDSEAYDKLYVEAESGFVRKTSKIDSPNGVASLKMRGLTDGAQVFLRGYIIFRNDTTGEIGVSYTAIVIMEKDSCTIEY